MSLTTDYHDQQDRDDLEDHHSTDESEKNSTLKPIIVVDKPHGMTSMNVVRILRRILKPTGITKVGYAGTLDPYATGVLIVGLGRSGTRQMGTFSDKDKEYVCEIDLLKDSVSGDMENFKQEYQKTLPDKFEIPALETIERLISTHFVGEIKQVPPQLSAIKINGKKACDLARKNIKIDMKERIVTIHKIQIESYEFPVLKLRVNCSKGTYIRTLGRDIGRHLGLWGTLVSLRRTLTGEYTLEDALCLDKIKLEDLMI